MSLWEADSVELLGTVHPPQSGGPVPAGADFVGKSHDVVIASYDGQLFSWDTDLDHTVEAVCRMAGRGLTREEWATYLPAQPYRDLCP